MRIFFFRINKRETLASGLLCLLGLAVVLQVSGNSAARVSGLGSGVLPVLVGALLMLSGVLWLFSSRLSPDEDEETFLGDSKWRGTCGLASGVFAFVLVGKYGGLVPALFASVYLTALGDSWHSWRSAIVPATGMTVTLAALAAWLHPTPWSMFPWG